MEAPSAWWIVLLDSVRERRRREKGTAGGTGETGATGGKKGSRADLAPQEAREGGGGSIHEIERPQSGGSADNAGVLRKTGRKWGQEGSDHQNAVSANALASRRPPQPARRPAERCRTRIPPSSDLGISTWSAPALFPFCHAIRRH